MDILGLLQDDHRRFLAVLERLDSRVINPENRYYTSGFSGDAGKTAAQLLEGLLPQLQLHEELEHDLLFPEILRWAPDNEQALESLAREHGSMEGLLRKFEAELPLAAERPMSRILLDIIHLSNTLRGHILREETGLYAVAEKVIPPAELERLGREAEKRLKEA